ncbi:hypothetical protein SAMN05421812_101218 [Asanoa hainanensis]|uniref:Uncharacterized protein n=1 Tax=Asanoa hainanensis TaxID=560556 RepID=A0A239G3W9_9ACTN|nr:hypothetical protein [Asanoa hainanensis]SNS63831.1 hypothetical protein SAMN05421812_101218 [Asanoa hainanensis]
MSDHWTWDDGHADHGDHGDHLEDHGSHDEHGGYEEPEFDSGADTDPFGVELGDHHLATHDDHQEWDDDSGADDPFAPHALVSEQHDWAAGLDALDADDTPAPLDATGLFGLDPDVSAYTDALWPTHEFPAALDLGADLPEPVDGAPWTDPATLGTLGPADLMPSDVPEPTDLAAYAGLDPASSGWETLLGSEDPATAALARFWGPPSA